MSNGKKTVLITGADRGIGYALTEKYLENGWHVFAGQFMPDWPQLDELKAKTPEGLTILSLDVMSDESVKAAADAVKKEVGTLDVLVNCAGIGGPDSPENIVRTFNANSVGPLRMVEAFLPLMQSGMRRLCFFSSEAGSIAGAHRTEGLGYGMSKSALNMAVRLMFNKLRPKGYTFRLYHPGWVRSYMQGKLSTEGVYDASETAEVSYEQFSTDRSWEDALFLVDIKNEAWPF